MQTLALYRSVARLSSNYRESYEWISWTRWTLNSPNQEQYLAKSHIMTEIRVANATQGFDKETIRDEFNAVAAVYESNRLSPWYKAHADEVLETVLQHGDAKHLIDIGCGTGYFLRNFLKKYPQSKAYGIDIAENMRSTAQQYAQRDGIENVKFIDDDWETLALQTLASENSDADIDTLVCANTFHYFSDPQAACYKMATLLNEGRLYLLERDNSRSFLTYFWDILHRRLIKDHVVFYDRNALFSMLQKAGFDDIKIEKHIKRYFWKGKLFTNLILISCKKTKGTAP